MDVKPIGNRILVKLVEQHERSQGGIYIPDTAKDKPQTGEVMAVGDGDEVKCKVGERVLFAKFSGTEIKIDGQEHLLLPTDDVLAIVAE